MDFRKELRQILADNTRVLVVGMGISGVETSKFLLRAGIPFLCVERQEKEKYLASKYGPNYGELSRAGAEIHFGIDGEKVASLLSDVGLCVLSPGVSLESSICGTLRRHDIKMISELELGIELTKIPAIVVTGSNGKSTTVSLIHEMLKAGGFSSTLCGNVGVPVIAGIAGDAIFEEETKPKDNSFLVVEASSYQLESCSLLKPKIALFLNISDNHLERHGHMDRYLQIKAKVFERQTADDFAVINANDSRVFSLSKNIGAKVLAFGSPDSQKVSGAVIEYAPENGIDRFTLTIEGNSEEYLITGSRLRGYHNRLNIAAASLATRLAGAGRPAVESVIKTFLPLEHRLEEWGDINGVTFINDSKSTTVAATVAALNSVLSDSPSRKVSLMIGGLSKAGSWEPLMSVVKSQLSRLKPVVCFGQDARLLASHCRSNGIDFVTAPGLRQAAEQSLGQSESGDIVLLSPGCASFDEFSDFEDRGNVFKSLLKELKQAH